MKKVLVLCTGNSCRSIIGEALINAMGVGRYQASSAGSHPTGEIHPQALATLRNHNISIEQARSKSWNEFAEDAFDVVITVCDEAAQETCPVVTGKHQSIHWSIPDPARVEGSFSEIRQAFEATLEMLRTRIEKELLSEDEQR
jgi:arsenate reductase